MNREAVALGHARCGRRSRAGLGAVDEQLIASGRMRRLERPEQIELRKRDAGRRASACGATPRVLVALLLGAARAPTIG